MSLTREDIQAISQVVSDLLEPIRSDIQELKSDTQELKDENKEIRNDIQNIRNDIQNIRTDIQQLNRKVTAIELAIENEVNHNISLLAENHINLVNKLNDAIRVSDKTLLYEVQVSSLKSKIENLEREVTDIKNRIA